MKKGIILVALFILIAQLAMAQGVTIFEEPEFKGRSKKLTGDQRYIGDDWNDRISSIIVPAGYRIQVYTDSKYRGSSKILDHNWSVNSSSPEWNHQISSIKILNFPGQQAAAAVPVANTAMANATPVAGYGIVVYEDVNFRGQALNITSDMAFVGQTWNDRISSIRVPRGYRIQVFIDANYGGVSKIIDYDWSANTSGADWDNKISSIKILSVPGDQRMNAPVQRDEPGIIVYEDANYSGKVKLISESMSFVGQDFNDKISSIRIPRGYKIQVYVDANYGGASRIMDADWTATGTSPEWNDKISSIKILAYPQQMNGRR